MSLVLESAKLSDYYDKDKIDADVMAGRHRDAIGGHWETIGQLQLDFLRAQGLRPEHTLLDIGCGSVRAGVKLVRYLDAGNYYGTDISASLLRAGYAVELVREGLQDKLPPTHLMIEGDFNLSWSPVQYDFAIAQSVFSHLPLVHLRICLERLHRHMKPGGSFFATFFQIPEDHANGEPFRHAGGYVTYPAQDPYHHRLSEIGFCCRYLPWKAIFFGDWGHPFSQRMIQFVREP